MAEPKLRQTISIVPGTPRIEVAGVKKDTGKLEYHLVPTECLEEVVKVLTYSKRDKYSEDNWKKVPNARVRYLDAAERHVAARKKGAIIDSEWGLHHMAHAICCLLFVMWFDMRDILRKAKRRQK